MAKKRSAAQIAATKRMLAAAAAKRAGGGTKGKYSKVRKTRKKRKSGRAKGQTTTAKHKPRSSGRAPGATTTTKRKPKKGHRKNRVVKTQTDLRGGTNITTGKLGISILDRTDRGDIDPGMRREPPGESFDFSRVRREMERPGREGSAEHWVTLEDGRHVMIG